MSTCLTVTPSSFLFRWGTERLVLEYSLSSFHHKESPTRIYTGETLLGMHSREKGFVCTLKQGKQRKTVMCLLS
jgi:hypothetical protein